MSEQLHLDLDGGASTPHQLEARAGEATAIPEIPGLKYFPQFLSADEQATAIRCIDEESWRSDLERRVQHYGWRYDYRARTVDRDMHIGPLPAWLQAIAERLYDETGLFDRVPDQAIVNEYFPGQGIAMHADRQCFGPAVATVSLGDAWRMDLRPVGSKANARVDIMPAVGSALLMTGDARTRWLHGIAKRLKEPAVGGSRMRKRRLSLTFRTVLYEAEAGTQTLSAG